MPARETPARAARANALAVAQQRVGSTVDSKYKVTSLLAVGGMGVVYEAKHLFLDRTVAMKVLHPRYEDAHDAAKRFLREASLLGSLGHRAIVEVTDGGFVDGTTPYIVMERLMGENLAQRIERRKGLRLVQTIVVLREILKGLDAAHQKGIIHCDLKPENVFLVDRTIEAGKIKILDFGVARMAPSSRAAVAADENLRLYGTPEYMAPEQVTGEEIGPWTDVYAAGAVAYEALTGRAPFGTGPRARPAVFARILRERPASPHGVREAIPDAIESLIMQMLEKSPSRRPASAMDVLQLVDGMGISPVASVPMLRAAKPSKAE